MGRRFLFHISSCQIRFEGVSDAIVIQGKIVLGVSKRCELEGTFSSSHLLFITPQWQDGYQAGLPSYPPVLAQYLRTVHGCLHPPEQLSHQERRRDSLPNNKTHCPRRNSQFSLLGPGQVYSPSSPRAMAKVAVYYQAQKQRFGNVPPTNNVFKRGTYWSTVSCYNKIFEMIN